MTNFSGWEMPLQFGKVIEEHMAVRQQAGLFDISHMGIVLLSASDYNSALSFLNALVPQDLTKLTPGKAVYTQFLNEAGGILDDIIIYRLPDTLERDTWHTFTQLLVITNAGNTDTDMAWMETHKHKAHHKDADIRIELASSNHCLFALQGPSFEAVLKTFSGYNSAQLPKRFHIAENRLGDTPVLLSRTGYTGEDGVEIIVPEKQAAFLWEALLKQGETLGCKPIGLAARDTLRLEAAYPLHGNDITPETTPLEAGLEWSVRLTPENEFIGKAALLKQQSEGLLKRAYCLKIKKKAIARSHDKIYQVDRLIGEVTSGSISPLSNEAIAMAYLSGPNVFQPGERVEVIIRNQRVEAEIVMRPFYKRL